MTRDLSTVLATSVPDQERRFAEAHMSTARLHGEELSRKLAETNADARVLSPMIHDVVESETLAAFDNLEAIVTRSDGFDHLPADWMDEHGVAGYHLGGYATSSVAHHALMLVLDLLRRVPEAQAMTRSDPPGWDRSRLMGRHLQDVTVGVLGVGKIGSAVVRLVTDLGGTAKGFDIDPDERYEEITGFSYTEDLKALLAASDALTVHVPLDETTERMVGADELARLPESAVLVNTARGPIVDQAAVEAALDDGRLAGYATDVLPGEPQPPDLARFQGFDNVVITPHLAAYDERTTKARYERTARIAAALVAGDAGRVDRYRVI